MIIADKPPGRQERAEPLFRIPLCYLLYPPERYAHRLSLRGNHRPRPHEWALRTEHSVKSTEQLFT
jgi:hypothetical protein